MTRTLFCKGCGATRTLDTVRPHAAGNAPMTCFRCAGTLFTTVEDNAPRTRTAWQVTAADRRFLRSLRIATGDHVVGVVEAS